MKLFLCISLKILTVILSFLFTIPARSQHCPFDFSSIIVVTVHEKGNTENLHNLKITIVDSLANPITDTTFINDRLVVDTLLFWRNPDKSSYNSYIDNENPANYCRIRFPFANNNYVFVCSNGFPVKNYWLKIEDMDGRANGKYFSLPSIIKLYEQDKYPLCGNYGNEDYSYHTGRIYKPIEIIVVRIK